MIAAKSMTLALFIIERIANKSHVLMGNRSLYMEDAIATIATWRNAT
jgi:hypothetical protein